MLKGICQIGILSVVAAIQLPAQTQWSISFLQDLIRDARKEAASGDDLRLIEDIKTARDAKSLLPVAFEAINSKNLAAQLYGSVALFGIVNRPDGPALLSGEANAIMKMLAHSEARLKTTCVVLTQSAKLPPAIYEQQFLKFLTNPAEPIEVKPAVVGALLRSQSLAAEKASSISAFLRSGMPTMTKINAYNALASYPNDTTLQADLVAIGLRDSEENVRNFCIGLLQRLGRNATIRHLEELKRLAVSPEESSTVRQSAQRALNQQ